MRSRALLVLTVLALLLATACSDELSPEEQTIANVEAQTAPIDSALQNPSGTVDPANVTSVFDAIQMQGTASSAAGYVPGAGAPPSQTQGFGDPPCVTTFENGGTVDLGCASGGEVTGSVTYQVASADNTTYLYFDYDNVCGPDGDCIDGSGAEKIVNSGGGTVTITLAGEFDVTSDGVSSHISFGYQMSIGNGGLSVSYVVFVDGQSYVVSYEYDGTTWTYSVEGANGEFTCTATLTETTWSGSCTGSESFDF